MSKHAAKHLYAATAAVFVLTAGAGAGTGACGADLDLDGNVGTSDLLQLLSEWGTDPGGPPDFDGDGSVGTSDLLFLLSEWGPAVFRYPILDNPEAEQIGLEMLGAAGPLLIPQATYERIDRDLELIRAFEPALGAETHTPAWLANHLIVKVLQGVDTSAYACVNAFYQVINEQFLFSSGGGDWYVLTFDGNLNVPALVSTYTALAEVEFAEPDGIIGGQNFYTPLVLVGELWQWSIDDGFLDCFDGCDCHRLYTFQVDGPGTVTLMNYVESGQPWCDFGN